MQHNLNGKRFWIIGASSGIGRALSIELANAGVQLILSARREAELLSLSTALKGQGHKTYALDVADPAMIERVFQEITAQDDGIDSVIYLAAIYSADHTEQNNMGFIQQTIDINLMGMFRIMQHIIPYFKQRSGGQIVLTGSVAGYGGLPNGQPYSCTKAAVINYAQSLKIEMEPYNIDVRVINPGFVKTDLTAKNNFAMPMMISPEAAAQSIVKGLGRREFEIHFPKQFTYVMKFLQIIPRSLYFWLMRKQIAK